MDFPSGLSIFKFSVWVWVLIYNILNGGQGSSSSPEGNFDPPVHGSDKSHDFARGNQPPYVDDVPDEEGWTRVERWRGKAPGFKK